MLFRARGSGTDRFITLYSAKAYSASAWLQKLQPTSTEFLSGCVGAFNTLYESIIDSRRATG